MYAAIMFLVLTPVLGAVLFIIGLTIACLSKGMKSGSSGASVHPVPDVPPVMPIQEPSSEHPDIADQFDGRLTNVLKNPMKGIL